MTGRGLDNDYDIVIAGGGMIGASLAWYSLAATSAVLS